jgi:hypothetical protein
MARIDLANSQSTPAQTVTTAGSDDSDTIWGEYVSVSIDPSDNVTFWGTSEYFDTTQTQCPGQQQNGNTTCTWQTQIYNCYKGNASGFCP